MIPEAAGGGVIRQDVQDAIDIEIQYRLGEGDVPGALSRWQKELLLLVINAVKGNACLSQLHARAAIKAGATLAQVLQIILYVQLTGMVKWFMVGHGAYAAAEADVPESQRPEAAKEGRDGDGQRFQEINKYLMRDGRTGVPESWMKLAEVAPAVWDGFIKLREGVIPPDPLGAVPKKFIELAIVTADIVQAHPRGAVNHTSRLMKAGGTVPEIIEAVALAMIECGVQSYKSCGIDIIEAAEEKPRDAHDAASNREAVIPFESE
jgi:alkylhydroperoxidase/carboxymuconolactone decarboxylase family protein YurZ